MEVVYRWAKGEEFQAIMQYTDVDEGTIVRWGNSLSLIIQLSVVKNSCPKQL